MNIKIKNIMLSLFLLASVLFSAGIAFGYKNVCYDRNEIMPGNIVCNYDCCKVCETDNGYQSLPQNCNNVPNCECDGVFDSQPSDSGSGNTNTNASSGSNSGSGIDSQALTEIEARLSALEALASENRNIISNLKQNDTRINSELSNVKTDVSALQTLISALQNAITEIQNTLTNILNRITNLENAPAETLSGCAYNNPACQEGYECVFNECVQIQEGCQYNNPACDTGYECINNECIPLTENNTSEETNNNSQTGCLYNNPECQEGYECVNNECVISQNTGQTINGQEEKRVVFRTNVEGGYYRTRNGEIAVDIDKDGNLECFKYYSFKRSYYNRLPEIVGHTTEGYEIHKYTRGRIIINGKNKDIYKPESSCTIPLSSLPEEPYSSSGLEAYEE